MTLRRTGRLLAVAALACGLAACGKDGDGIAERDGGNGRPAQPQNGVGTITASFSAFPDALDPALANTAESRQVLWNVYTPLLTYRHAEGADGTELVPGLAEERPEISDDGRRYRLRLREGLRYADGSPVRAADFEHAIRRVLRLRSPGARFFRGIVGARAYERGRRAGADIAGIATDEREVTIRLTAPDGAFSHVLALGFAGLVPGDTPFRDMTRDPPPGAGAFRLADVRPGRGYVLADNRRFDVDDLPQAALARIVVRIERDTARQAQATVDGDVDLLGDPPPPGAIAEIRDRFDGERYREWVTGSASFFFLNARTPPFDDRRVRQAASIAVDRRALARAYGGLLAPACTFLPPTVPGHAELDPCPSGDPNQAPDVGRASALVQAAGARGREVIVYGYDEPAPRRAAQLLAAALNRIGLRARARIVEGATYYRTVGDARLRAQAGVADVFQDYPHPADLLELVDGRAIRPTRNPNLGNVDDPAIDRALARLNRAGDLGEAASGYAAIDRRLTTAAHLIPFGHRELTVFLSERMDTGDECAVAHPVYGADLSRLCEK